MCWNLPSWPRVLWVRFFLSKILHPRVLSEDISHMAYGKVTWLSQNKKQKTLPDKPNHQSSTQASCPMWMQIASRILNQRWSTRGKCVKRWMKVPCERSEATPCDVAQPQLPLSPKESSSSRRRWHRGTPKSCNVGKSTENWQARLVGCHRRKPCVYILYIWKCLQLYLIQKKLI